MTICHNQARTKVTSSVTEHFGDPNDLPNPFNRLKEERRSNSFRIICLSDQPLSFTLVTLIVFYHEARIRTNFRGTRQTPFSTHFGNRWEIPTTFGTLFE